MKKIFLYGIVALFTICLSGYGFVSYMLNRSVPKKTGSVDLEYLKDEVKVFTDKWGIPHIYAKNQIDAYRVLGYTVASERLFQMDLMRRIASGRLSEILGEETLKIDHLLRKLRIRKTMEDYYEKNKSNLDPLMLESAQAFFDGVHQFMKTNPLPIEFTILGYEPEPFSIIDSMGVSGYMALSFAEGMIGDVLFSELAKDVPQDQLAQLRVGAKPYFEEYGFAKNSSFINKRKLLKTLIESSEFLNDFFFMFHGSNSWVISGKRTKSGKPLLANDPHIAYSNPSVWFEAHIHTPEWELYGHYLPLVPFAVLGHNKNKAWAVTMSEADDFDFFIEKTNPNNPDEVEYKGKWEKLTKETYQVKVKGKDKPVEGVVRISKHGPLLDGLEQSPKDKTIALSWSYYHPENDIMSAIYGLGQAKTLEDYKSAISKAAAPGLNISWVDQEGNIAWWMMGKIPKRAKGIDSDILLEGWHGKHEYLGYLSFEENPHQVNPESGIIISTNFKPLQEKYDYIDGYWQPAERMERLQELFKDKSILWDIEKTKAIQTDVKANSADQIKKILLASVSPQNDTEKEVVKYLKDWDSFSTVDSVGSAIYHVWGTYVMRHALLDEMGEDRFKGFSRLADYLHFYKVFIKDPSSPWWDNIKKPEKVIETREMIVEEAFHSMISYFKKKFGNNTKNWKWGDVHTVEYVHPIGKVKPFNHLFNIGPLPAPGSYSQVNNISFKRGSLNYESHLGPSTRRIIDLGNPLISYGILPTGNSGHVKSTHYDDQAKMYVDGKYRKQLLHIDDIKADSIGELTFK